MTVHESVSCLVAVIFLGMWAPSPASSQELLWPVSSENRVDVEFARPARAASASSFAYYPETVRLEGALFVSLQLALKDDLALVADLPVAYLSGRVDSCVDGACPEPTTGAVVGNPRIAARYAVPGRALWLEVGIRAPVMDLDPWQAGPGVDTWGRRVDEMAAVAAGAAEAAGREEAFFPHAWTASVDAVGARPLGAGVRVGVRTGLAWIDQHASETYSFRFPGRTELDLRYDVRLSRRFGAARLDAGVLGRGELHGGRRSACQMAGFPCRFPAEAEVTGAYTGGSVVPAVQLRLPLGGGLKDAVRWTLAAGMRIAWEPATGGE